MTAIPRYIEFLGADDSVNPRDLIAESGWSSCRFTIKMDPDKFGTKGFPSLGWISELFREMQTSYEEGGIAEEGGYCTYPSFLMTGSYVDKFLEDRYFGMEDIFPPAGRGVLANSIISLDISSLGSEVLPEMMKELTHSLLEWRDAYYLGTPYVETSLEPNQASLLCTEYAGIVMNIRDGDLGNPPRLYEPAHAGRTKRMRQLAPLLSGYLGPDEIKSLAISYSYDPHQILGVRCCSFAARTSYAIDGDGRLDLLKVRKLNEYINGSEEIEEGELAISPLRKEVEEYEKYVTTNE